MQRQPPDVGLEFLAGGGEMGKLIRAFPWTGTALGEPRSLGPEKHPAILGAPGRRAWEEVWPVVGAQIEQVLRGEVISNLRSEGGLGIGLALVKGIIELHGGRVEARSGGLGSGSEFRVYLPRATRPPAALREVAALEPAPPTRRRILSADDNRDAAESPAILSQACGIDRGRILI
jgi:hypothetical protein